MLDKHAAQWVQLGDITNMDNSTGSKVIERQPISSLNAHYGLHRTKSTAEKIMQFSFAEEQCKTKHCYNKALTS